MNERVARGSQEDAVPAFLSGGGEAGALIRARDWSLTPLGRPEGWPQPLKTLVGVILGSNQPMFVAWGEARLMLYNDGYAEFCRDRHPAALGAGLAAVWHDIMDDIGPIVERTFAGHATQMDDIMFTLQRDGRPQEAHFAFSYTPVRDEAGTVAGLFCACQETTGQVLAQRSSLAERETFEQLFRQAPGFMAMLQGPDHRFSMANPAYLRLIGRRDVVGMTVAEALPDAVAQGYLALLDQVFASGRAFTSAGAKYAVQTVPDGPVEEHFVDFVFQPVTDPDGRVTGIFVEGSDVTQRLESQFALRESEALNALILDSSRDCIVVLDLDGNTQFVSRGGIEAMEISDVAAIIGLSWLRVWKGEDNAAAARAVADARAGGVGRFQGFCPTHKGTAKWWDVVISPLPGPDGRPERLVSTGRDITESREAKRRLEASEERLSLALGASSMVGIWDWDLVADVIYADVNFARIYSVDPAWAARGAPLAEYVRTFHPDDMPAFQAELDRLFGGAGEFACEYRILQPDGSVRWVLARGRLVRDADGRPVRFPGATVDITERKIAEVQRADLTREMSHRMKNTLAMVQAIATQTFRQVKTVEEGREAISGRLAALARAQDILTRGEGTAADIREVVENALAPHGDQDLNRFAVSGPTVELTAQQGLGLSLALHELATNAAKYGALSEGSGQVTIAWTHDEAGAFAFSWVETGGPPVTPPTRTGFGSRLIERIVGTYFAGTGKLAFEPAGVTFRLAGLLETNDASAG